MADKNTHLENAQKYLQKGQLDKAIKEYYRVLDADPKDVRTRHKLGELLSRQGAIDAALFELNQVADAYSSEGFFLKAVAVYKQMIKLKEDLFDVHLRLGELYQQLSLRSEALEHFSLVAGYLEGHGTQRECLEIYKRIAELSPEDTHIRFTLADLYVQEGMKAEALAIYRVMVNDLTEKNQTDDLIKAYERLVQLHQRDLDAQKALARLYMSTHEPKKALSRLQVCFKVDPGDPETLSHLGDLFIALDQTDKARNVLEELGRIYAYQGNKVKEAATSERLRRLTPPEAVVSHAPPPRAREDMSSSASRIGQPGAGSAPPTYVVGRPMSRPPGSPEAAEGRSSSEESSPAFATPPPPRPVAAPVAPVRVAPVPVAPVPVAAVADSPTPPTPRAYPAAEAVPHRSVPPGEVHAGKLRDIPPSLARLLTELDVFVRYGLREKAAQHFEVILQREPRCYAVREKRRDFLLADGLDSAAATECIEMASIAEAFGDRVQARMDLDQAHRLDPDRVGVKPEAEPTRGRSDALSQSPLTFMASSFTHGADEEVHMLIEEEDEEEPETPPLARPYHPSPPVGPPVAGAGSIVPGAPQEESGDREGQTVFLTLSADQYSVVEDGPEDSPPLHLAGRVLEDVLVVPAVAFAPGEVFPAEKADAPEAGTMPDAGHPVPVSFFAPPPVPPSSFSSVSSAFALHADSESEEGLDLLKELEGEFTGESEQYLAREVDRATRSFELAQAYFQMHLYEESQRELEKSVTFGPLGYDGEWLLGLCYYHRGEPAQAVNHLKSVLNRTDLPQKQELEILFDLAMAYEALEEWQMARDLLEEVSTIDREFRERDVRARLREISAHLSPGGPQTEQVVS